MGNEITFCSCKNQDQNTESNTVKEDLEKKEKITQFLNNEQLLLKENFQRENAINLDNIKDNFKSNNSKLNFRKYPYQNHQKNQSTNLELIANDSMEKNYLTEKNIKNKNNDLNINSLKNNFKNKSNYNNNNNINNNSNLILKTPSKTNIKNFSSSIYSSSSNYIGKTDSNNLKTGFRIQKWRNGTKYIGNYLKNKSNGFGCFYHFEGDKYIG